jgi:dTDP-4-amino-4,6-dideoxygalactose transaminase
MQVPLIDLQTQYSSIRDEIRIALDAVLTRQKFILDTEVASFEGEIAELCGARFAIGCASGTDALLLSLLALQIGEGDEVITTACSFFSTAEMISWIGAKPVFVDIDPRTFLMRSEQVRHKITLKTKAVVAVHLFGQCARMDELEDAGIPVIEDAAQAIGASQKGKAAGSLGITGCFSFFPTKNLGGYGDGGMITTSDETIAARLRLLRAHGQGSTKYLHEMVGTNSRLDELQAAVLRVKLKHLAKWNRRRNENAQYYYSQLQDLPVELPALEPGNTHIYHQFVIKTPARDRLLSFLSEKGIGTAIYYPVPLPFQPCFSKEGYQRGEFPDAEEFAETSLALPVHPELTEQQLDFVSSQINSFFH